MWISVGFQWIDEYYDGRVCTFMTTMAHGARLFADSDTACSACISSLLSSGLITDYTNRWHRRGRYFCVFLVMVVDMLCVYGAFLGHHSTPCRYPSPCRNTSSGLENEAVTSSHHYSMILYLLMPSTLKDKMNCPSIESLLTPTLTLTYTFYNVLGKRAGQASEPVKTRA